MDCEKIREIISAELDGEATDDQLVGAYRHLADCPECRNWRREVLVIKGTFAFREDHPLPPSVTEQLRRAESATPPVEKKQWKSIYRVPRPLAWVAAVLIVLQIGWSSYQIAAGPRGAKIEMDNGVPDTIVLTAMDRISSTTVVRTSEEYDNHQQTLENGG